jgi:SAM-dependent methyltransferase
MFSIVKRSKREAEKARYTEKKEVIKKLRERLGRLLEEVKKQKQARNEAREQGKEWQRQLEAQQDGASLARRLAAAEIRVSELEQALLTAEATPLPQPLAFPLPPPDMRRRIGSNYAGVDFLAGARSLAERVVALVRDSGYDPAAFRSILDWGCGCGRMALQAASLFPNASYHGADIDAEAIGWCQEHLAAAGRFEVCPEFPPAPYPPGSFDIILGLSVFTHLRLADEKQWLEELARLARPGALLILSYLREETVAGFGLGEKQMVDREDGFTCYASAPEDGLPYFNLTSSHTEDCLRSLWGRRLDILSIHPTGFGLQGVVMALAKK